MGAFNACPMAIGVLESLRALSLARRKKRLHLLSSSSFGKRSCDPPLTIALNPLDWHVGVHPLGRSLREHIQDIAHGLSHAQRAVVAAALGRDLARVVVA